jgi:predicted nucleotidyltransferase
MTMKTRDEIVHTLRKALPAIRARYPLGNVLLFGSYCRGEQTETSDVDLAVEFTGRISYRDQVALQEELSALLGVPVDLAEGSSLKHRIRERVAREAVPV